MSERCTGFFIGLILGYYTIVVKVSQQFLCAIVFQQVILSDGDLSTLANMKFNLELNNLNVETDMLQRNEDTSTVSLSLQCHHFEFCFDIHKMQYSQHSYVRFCVSSLFISNGFVLV